MMKRPFLPPLAVLILCILACLACGETTGEWAQIATTPTVEYLKAEYEELPPIYYIAPIVPVNVIPIHAPKHLNDRITSDAIAKEWIGRGYKAARSYYDYNKEVHVIRMMGENCIIVVSKTSRIIITAFVTEQTQSQIHGMLLSRGFGVFP